MAIMQMDLLLISGGDHLVEAANLFRDHIALQFETHVPYVLTSARSEERWLNVDKVLAPVGFGLAGQRKPLAARDVKACRKS
jgi:hypothetical protein